MSITDQPQAPSASAGIMPATQVANTQQSFNTGAQRGSMVNESNPWGGITWKQTGTGPNGVPIYSMSVNPSAGAAPAWANTLQGIGLASGAGAGLLQGANYANSDPTTAIGNMTSGLTGQQMNSWLSGVEPFFNTQTSQQDAILKNQGFTPGTPGYDNAMRQLQTNQNLSVEQAAAQFQPQAFSEATSLYQMPMTMGEQLAQWGVPQSPTSQLVQAPQLQPADVTSAYGMAQSAAEQQYNAQMQQYSGMLQGMSQMAGAGLDAAMLASDIRVKEDISEVGSLYDGTPVYSYRYLNDPVPQVGVIAQDVEKRRPDAVREIGGIKHVDYRKATERSRMISALTR